MTSIILGQGRDGSSIELDLPELLATRLLVQGNSGSGKSHLLRRLLEQTANVVQQVMIDPEGDFVTLAEHYGHLVIDVEDQSEASLRAAGERVRAHRASVVLNLEHVEAEMQLRAAGAFLNGMFEAPRAHWYPVLVVVDEAQLFAPVAGGDTTDEARRLSLGAMTNLMCRGRKRGLAGVIATQRLAKLAKNVAAEASNFLMGRTFLDIDMARAADLLGMERRTAESFRDLARGQFMALGPALSRRPKLVAIGSVETASHATGPILVPLEPVPAEELRDIILEPIAELSPRPRRENRPPPPDLLAQLDAYGTNRDAAEISTATATTTIEADPDTLWSLVSEVASGDDADYKPLATLYQDFQLRARILGLPRTILDLPSFQRILINSRVGLDRSRAETEEWQQAEHVAHTLPEDVRGVFLLLARHAWDALPCPDDDALARAYGTHSLGRARRQLNYLEEREVIVLQQTSSQRRVAIVGIGWSTT
ncbi:GMP reductase [Neokomagataea thailandica NBRC 106555]|uniref:ATP-binding protein n=2 Tax=Neokomagataea TaxID=1223423 RepID=A0A4Y6V8X9_9PROT|nr:MULTISPECIES: ATP-binding protein [Neokomagataea]QDH25338.1 ATP-binding protein [Neokomagataea tanensis]GBR54322.1 GMP reductase [Neokomagataea thailandica NBRC 106555]